MILRLLFVLLCVLNIVLAAWLWLGQPYAPAPPPPSDPGVATLRLLTEVPAAAATVSPLPVTAASAGLAATDVDAEGLAVGAASTAPAPVSTSVAGMRCVALGPFSTPQELRGVRTRLAPRAERARARQEVVPQSGSWWVYLPAARSHAAALASARELADRRISDYFVVGDGDQANSISLGVFKDPANARRRRDEVAAAGFPVQMAQRTQTTLEYWLDVVLRPGAMLDASVPLPAGAGQHATACF